MLKDSNTGRLTHFQTAIIKLNCLVDQRTIFINLNKTSKLTVLFKNITTVQLIKFIVY